MNNKKKTILTVIGLLLLVSLIVGTAYAMVVFTKSSDVNSIKTGKISMHYTESSNVISINNALPVTDEVGKNQTNYFEFSITSNADTNADDSEGIKIPYNLILEPKTIDSDKDSFLASDIKVYLTKVNGSSEEVVKGPVKLSELTPVDTNFKLYNTKNVHKNNNGMISTKYRLRAWIDYGVDSSTWQEGTKQKQYKFAINVNSSDKITITYKLGDVNDNGTIDIFDVQALYEFLNNTSTLDPTYVLHAGDVNGDGKVDESDRELINKYSSRQITTFPAGEPLEERTYEAQVK